MSVRSLNGLSSSNIYVNTVSGGSAINVATSNSTSSTVNVKISKETAKTTLVNTDLFLLEEADGSIKKITYQNLNSNIDTNFWDESNDILRPLYTSSSVLVGGTNMNISNFKFQVEGNSYINGNLLVETDTNSNNRQLLITGTAEITGNIYLNTISSGTWNGSVLGKSYLPTDTVYDADIASFITLTSLTTATSFSTSQGSGYTIGRGGSDYNYTNTIKGWNIKLGETPNSDNSDTGSVGTSSIDLLCKTGGADNTINIIASPVWNQGVNSTINITASSRSGTLDSGASNINITANDSSFTHSNGCKITLSALTEVIINSGFKINSSGAISAVGSKITNGLIDTGITNNKLVEIDTPSSTVADNDYAKFTANGLEGRSYSEVKTDLSLNNVENTAISTFSGSSNITTLGTITSGVWNGTAISANYGGTGFQTYTIGDILYANTTTTLTKLNVGSANTFLMSNGSNPLWGLGYSFTNPLGISGTTVNLGNLSGWGSNNQILATNGSDTFEYRTLVAGSGITIGNTTSTITITGPSVYWKRNTNIGSFDIETTTDVDNIDITVPFKSSSYLKATSGFTNGASTESLKYVDYNVGGGTTVKVLEIYNTLNGSIATQLKFLHNSSGSYYPVIKTDTNADFIIHHENAGDRFKVSRFWEYGHSYAMWYYDNSAFTYFRNPSGTNSANSFAGSYFAFHNNGSAIYSNLPSAGTSSGDYHSFATGGNQFARMDATGSGKITGSWTGSWQGTSDRRLKKNIIPLTKAKETLMKINVYEFDKYDIVNYNTIHSETEKDKLKPFKERLSKTSRKVYGFIAQELCENTEELGKMCVDTNDWGNEEPAYIIDDRPILACAIKTIQEQQEEIHNLHSEISSLKSQLSDITDILSKNNIS